MDYSENSKLEKIDYIASVVLQDMIILGKSRLYVDGADDLILETFASYWNLNLIARHGQAVEGGRVEEIKQLEKMIASSLTFGMPNEVNLENYQANVGLLIALKPIQPIASRN